MSERGPSVGLNLTSEPTDQHIDAPIVGRDFSVPAPNRLANLIARKNLWAARKYRQERELSGGYRHILTGWIAKGPTRQIERIALEYENSLEPSVTALRFQAFLKAR